MGALHGPRAAALWLGWLATAAMAAAAVAMVIGLIKPSFLCNRLWCLLRAPRAQASRFAKPRNHA